MGIQTPSNFYYSFAQSRIFFLKIISQRITRSKVIYSFLGFLLHGPKRLSLPQIRTELQLSVNQLVAQTTAVNKALALRELPFYSGNSIINKSKPSGIHQPQSLCISVHSVQNVLPLEVLTSFVQVSLQWLQSMSTDSLTRLPARTRV